MTTVFFHCIRHGHRLNGGDELSALGYNQVEASTISNLTGFKFREAYYSGLHRAAQTAAHALEVLDQRGVDVIREDGFNFEWFEKDPNMPGPKGTPPDYQYIGEYMHKGYPLAIATRGRVWQTLLDRAKELARILRRDDTIHVLVASHSPTIETAVPDPMTFPRLQLTDVCVYEVQVDSEGNAKIVNAVYKPAPKIEPA